MYVERVDHWIARVLSIECEVEIGSSQYDGFGTRRDHALAGIDKGFPLGRLADAGNCDLLVDLA